MTADSLQLAYREGGQAYYKGLSLFENPYEMWDTRYDYWQRGYCQQKDYYRHKGSRC